MRAGRASGILASGVHMLKLSGNRYVRTGATLLLHAETLETTNESWRVLELPKTQVSHRKTKTSTHMKQLKQLLQNVVVSAYAPRAAAASFSLKSSDMTLAAESKTAAGGCAEASIVSTPASLDGPNKQQSQNLQTNCARASSFIPPSTWPPSLLLFIRQQHRPVKPSELLRGGLQHEKHSQKQSEFCPLDMKPFLASTARALLSLRPPPLSASTTNQLVFRCEHIHPTISLQGKMRGAPEQTQISTLSEGSHVAFFFETVK